MLTCKALMPAGVKFRAVVPSEASALQVSPRSRLAFCMDKPVSSVQKLMESMMVTFLLDSGSA
jgi:hypothetical protein